MTKQERNKAYIEYSRRSPKELAEMLVQCDDSFEKRSAELTALRERLSKLEAFREAASARIRSYVDSSTVCPGCDGRSVLKTHSANCSYAQVLALDPGPATGAPEKKP